MSDPRRTADELLKASLSRRQVLKGGLLAGSAAFLAACNSSVATQAPATAAPATAAPATAAPATAAPATPAPTAAASSAAPSVAASSAAPATPAPTSFAGVKLNGFSGGYSIHAETIGLNHWKAATGGDATFDNVPFNEKPIKLASIIATQDSSWDTIYTYSKFMFQFGQRLLIQVDDWYGDTSDFIPATITEFSSPDGVLRGLPFHHSGYAWAWNKKLFTKAGLDPENPIDNWPDLIAATPKFAAAGIIPCVQPWLGEGGTFGDFYYKIMYNSLNVPFLSPDRTQVKFDGDEGLEVFRTIEDGLKASYWDPQTLNIANEHDAFTLWDKGDKYATLIIGTDSVPTLPATDFGIKAMPGMATGTTGTVNGDDGIGISKFSGNQDACKSYMLYTFNHDVAKEICLATPELYPPTRLSILDDPDVQAANKNLIFLKGQAAGSEDLWSAPYDYSPIFDDVMHKLVKGDYTAAQAQNAAVKGVQDLIIKYLSA